MLGPAARVHPSVARRSDARGYMREHNDGAIPLNPPKDINLISLIIRACSTQVLCNLIACQSQSPPLVTKILFFGAPGQPCGRQVRTLARRWSPLPLQDLLPCRCRREAPPSKARQTCASAGISFLSAWGLGWHGTALLRRRCGAAAGLLGVAAGGQGGGMCVPGRRGGVPLLLKGAAAARALSRASACGRRSRLVRPDVGLGVCS